MAIDDPPVPALLSDAAIALMDKPHALAELLDAREGDSDGHIARAMSGTAIEQLALPVRIRDLAESCGFEVHGWHDRDSVSVIVQTPRDLSQVGERHRSQANRPVVDYIGSRDEAVAFMTAWSQCKSHKVAELMHDEAANEKIRQTIIPLGTSHLIEPNQSVQISERPQRGAFRGYRVAIPRPFADLFDVMDLRVGNMSTFEVSGDIPGVAFAIDVEQQSPCVSIFDRGEVTVEISRAAKEQFGRAWSMPVTQTAMDLTISVRNKSSVPSAFCALIMGRSANNWR